MYHFECVIHGYKQILVFISLFLSCPKKVLNNYKKLTLEMLKILATLVIVIKTQQFSLSSWFPFLLLDIVAGQVDSFFLQIN